MNDAERARAAARATSRGSPAVLQRACAWLGSMCTIHNSTIYSECNGKRFVHLQVSEEPIHL